MPKRLTDTDKWKKRWYRKLPPKWKCFWIYILDNCNAAGIWDVDIALAQFHIREELSINEAKQIFEEQIEVIGDGKKWFIFDFVEFQYKCTIDELNPTNKAHLGVIRLLEKAGILGKDNSQRNDHSTEEEPDAVAQDEDEGEEEQEEEENEDALSGRAQPFYKMSAYYHQQKKNQFPNVSTLKKKFDQVVDSGAETLGKMHDIDEVSVDEIKRILRFCLVDDFWKDQVISLSGLRRRKEGANDLMKWEKIARSIPDTFNKDSNYSTKQPAVDPEVKREIESLDEQIRNRRDRD